MFYSKVIFIILFSSFLFSNPLDLLKEEDKQKHFLASSAISTASYYYLDNNFDLTNSELVLYSIFITVLIGDIKERYWEKNYNIGYDIRDMRANLYGATFGTTISFFNSELQNRTKQKVKINKIKRLDR